MSTRNPMSSASNIASVSEIIRISPEYASIFLPTRHQGNGQFLFPFLPVLDEKPPQVRLPQPFLIECETPQAPAAAQAPEVKGVKEMLE